MKHVLFVVVVGLVLTGCGTVKNQVVKDLPLEEQELVLKEYKDRYVWSRGVLQDLGEGGTVLRDEKVQIVDVSMHFNGAVTVQTLKKKNKVRVGLEIERPLTKEKIDKRLTEIFFFDDPTLRHVAYIRKFGKKTASAIMEHSLFAGMSSEALLESWGLPMRTTKNELAGNVTEQWAYPIPNSNQNRYVYLKNGKVEKWDE